LSQSVCAQLCTLSDARGSKKPVPGGDFWVLRILNCDREKPVQTDAVWDAV
jgi:hypothetical protein